METLTGRVVVRVVGMMNLLIIMTGASSMVISNFSFELCSSSKFKVLDFVKIKAEKIKLTITDETINKLAKYVHNVLGLRELNCNYDIN